jgi:hypothetical protein
VIHDTHEISMPVAVYPDIPPVVDPPQPTQPRGAAPDLVVKVAITRESILRSEMDARGVVLNGLRKPK